MTPAIALAKPNAEPLGKKGIDMIFGSSKTPSTPTPTWAPLSPRGDIYEVDVAWVRGAPEEVRRIDVREAAELQSGLGAMDGAEHIPLGRLATEAATWTNKQTPIVVLCRSGGRSMTGAATLQKLGFTQVASMRGGMIAWREAGA